MFWSSLLFRVSDFLLPLRLCPITPQSHSHPFKSNIRFFFFFLILLLLVYGAVKLGFRLVNMFWSSPFLGFPLPPFFLSISSVFLSWLFPVSSLEEVLILFSCRNSMDANEDRTPAQEEPNTAAADWRTGLWPDSRKRIVNKMWVQISLSLSRSIFSWRTFLVCFTTIYRFNGSWDVNLVFSFMDCNLMELAYCDFSCKIGSSSWHWWYYPHIAYSLRVHRLHVMALLIVPFFIWFLGIWGHNKL